MSKFLVTLGLILVVLGLLWPWMAKLGLGRLPGDIVIEREGLRIYVPIVTCIVISLLLTAILWLFRR